MTINDTEKPLKKEKEKRYYFNVYKGDIVETFHMGEKEARRKYGDFEADENGNVVITEEQSKIAAEEDDL